MDDQNIMKIFRNIVSTVDDICQMKDKLCAAVLEVLPEDGKKFSNVLSSIQMIRPYSFSRFNIFYFLLCRIMLPKVIE